MLPLLAVAPDIRLAVLLGEMRAELARRTPTGGIAASQNTVSDETEESGGCGGQCACGGGKEADVPELDVRSVPHALRHATVFGALDAVPAGAAMVLIAPHDPLPLLAQIEDRSPGTFSVEYLERGPEAWRLQLSHR